MISFISLFEIIGAVVTDWKVSFWTAASVSDADAINLNGINTLLANGKSTFFINEKATDINDLRKLRNPSFNKIPLFTEDLITFAISFISLFVSVISEAPIP